MNLNKVILAGNLTRDPELRYTPRGSAVCAFGIAINRKFKADGEAREEVTFVDCTAFGTTAENVSKYFQKGRKIFVEGRLKLDQWEDKNTQQKRSKLGVVCDSFQFVDSKRDGSHRSEPQPAAAQQGFTTPPNTDGAAPPEEDDVPF